MAKLFGILSQLERLSGGLFPGGLPKLVNEGDLVLPASRHLSSNGQQRIGLIDQLYTASRIAQIVKKYGQRSRVAARKPKFTGTHRSRRTDWCKKMIQKPKMYSIIGFLLVSQNLRFVVQEGSVFGDYQCSKKTATDRDI